MVSVLSPFPLKMGRIKAAFAESEKAFLLRSLLIMLIKWESIIFAGILTIFGGILSGSVAFLAQPALLQFEIPFSKGKYLV